MKSKKTKEPTETKEELLKNISFYFDKILLDSSLIIYKLKNYREIEDTYVEDIRIKKRWFSEDKVILSKKFVPGKLIFSYNTIKNVNSNIVNTYTCNDLKELKTFETLLKDSYIRMEGIKNDLLVFKVFIAD